MRWTTADGERTRAQLAIELRVAGAAGLVDELAGVATSLGESASWCVAISNGRAVLLAADRERLVFVDRPDDPQYLEARLSDVTSVSASADGITFELGDRRIHLESGPAHRLADFVAHVATHLPNLDNPCPVAGTDPGRPS